MKLLELMLTAGCYVGIATHDSVLVDGAVAMIRTLGLRKDQYEFQMLLGVRPELRKKLVRDGHKVRLYVPVRRALVRVLDAAVQGEPRDRRIRVQGAVHAKRVARQLPRTVTSLIHEGALMADTPLSSPTSRRTPT